MELTLSHVSIALSGSIFVVVLKMSIQLGRYIQQFEEMKQRVRLHDKMLGIPVAASIGDE